jgi:hypothetical protein
MIRLDRRRCDVDRIAGIDACLGSTRMIGTILIYRNDRGRPSAEVRLSGGDHVVLALHSGGVAIDGFDPGGQRRPLFRGNVDTVARICAAVTPTAGLRSTPLDRLLGIVVRFGSARDLAAAFTAAAAVIH